MGQERTIYACSTAPGRAGIAVIRISGPAASTALEALGGPLPAPRRLALRSLREAKGGQLIDRGLVAWLPGPESFSGEDMAELHVHGGLAVVEELCAQLSALADVRAAEPGEFTRRAFANGRLDLMEAEGIGDLIGAETRAQRQLAARQMSGEISAIYEAWRERLVRALGYLEADLDFADEEDVPENLLGQVGAECAAVAAQIGGHLAAPERGERLRAGVRVVLAGAPNAGKSTLLNALARRDVAIISKQAGTTRDVLEVHLDLDGYPVTLTDTAGLRRVADEVEAEGVRRAEAAIGAADIIVWLQGADRETAADEPQAGGPPPAGPEQTLVRVTSKWDLKTDSPPNQSLEDETIALSVHRGWGLDVLISRIGSLAAELCGTGTDLVITRLRHREALAACVAALERFAVLADAGERIELQAEELRLATRALGQVTGRTGVEQVLDVIFADFCIGK